MQKKLTREQDMIILDRFLHDEATQAELAKEYGVSQSAISSHIHWTKLLIGSDIMRKVNTLPPDASYDATADVVLHTIQTIASQYNIRTDTVQTAYVEATSAPLPRFPH